jgi:hypothetical protein
MRKQLMPWVVGLTLALAATLAAQSPQPPGHLDTPGSTYSTGTVISQSANAITLRNDAGETRIFLLDEGTVGVRDFAAGTRVKVDFVLDDQGRAIAQHILASGAGEQPSATGYGTPAPGAAPGEAAEQPAQGGSYPAAEPTAAATDDGDKLPATASPLGLLALLGLGAAGAGSGLRLARKRS